MKLPIVQGLVLIAVAAVAFLNPLTAAWSMAETPAITDPDDPRFDPNSFRVEHYDPTLMYPAGTDEWKKDPFIRAMLRMFPPGTDKAYVEKILVKQADATPEKNETGAYLKPGHSDYSYIWSVTRMAGRMVHFIYDENNKSVSMQIGKRLLYGYDSHKKETP